jgi:hypothetical protein
MVNTKTTFIRLIMYVLIRVRAVLQTTPDSASAPPPLFVILITTHFRANIHTTTTSYCTVPPSCAVPLRSPYESSEKTVSPPPVHCAITNRPRLHLCLRRRPHTPPPLHIFFPHALSRVAATHLRLRYTRGSFHIIPVCVSACPSPNRQSRQLHIQHYHCDRIVSRVHDDNPWPQGCPAAACQDSSIPPRGQRSCQLEWLNHRFSCPALDRGSSGFLLSE